MRELFECVAQAIKEKGLRGLCELAPGGPYIYDVAGHAYKLYSERKKAAAQKAEIAKEVAKAAAASLAEAKQVAEEVARQVAHEAPVEERIALELYLTQLPGAVRQSLKRAADPSGETVPPGFALDAPEDFVKMLPLRVPHFRPGGELPGRPGWRLDELLGAGGFGEVWLARHALLPHPRAVKFCTDAKLRTKLTSHEGRVIARVMGQGTHPNVVPLLDAVLDGETPWLMYEYVGGGSLTDLILRWQNLPEREREAQTLLSLTQLALAAGTFHNLAPAIVHRDLKPANILVSAEPKTGGTSTGSALKITDFGIGGAAVEQPGGASRMTAWLETSLRGSYTPLYASPEQKQGAAPDPRDDVFALGVIAFQMLTGKLAEAPSPRFDRDLRRRGVSDPLINLIGDCVDSEPSARPKDAAELAERLGKLKNLTLRPSSLRGKREPEVLRTAPVPDKAQKVVDQVPTPPFLLGKGAGGFGSYGPLEGGLEPVTILPVAKPVEAEKWLVPLRGMWFSRSADVPDAPWVLSGARLPGEVVARPGEAYRLALNPDTGDNDIAKLKALVGLPGLEAVDASGCVRVTDTGLMHLAHLRGLKAVGLAETQVTDSGVTLLLTRFPDLEAVVLSGSANVSEAVIPHLARMRRLKHLALPPRADTPEVRAEFAKRRPACHLV